jgi:hypothetical protein
MNLDIGSLFPDLEALTPDGRWKMLQDWLAKNPEYGERVDRWSTQTVDRVFTEICLMATERYGAIAGMVLSYPTTQSKLKRSIEILQACYRERAGINNQSEKEIKNVRRKQQPKGRSGKNPPKPWTRRKRTG